MSNVLSVDKCRKRLKHAWVPFFGKFGNLTEVQLRTIPGVLRGNNVVVAAPTAAGKTEAVVAPLAQRHVNEQWSGLAVIYLVPTRALGNDMIGRLEGPLEAMYITGALKHGDSPTLPAGEIHWLVTTPESLDSLICREPARLQSVRAVIVDEIHLLDGTYRGDQVRILLQRLQRLVGGPLTVNLLSATLPNPTEVAGRYLKEFQVVNVGGCRPIEAHILDSQEEVLELAKVRHFRKLLVFCNTRQGVEEVAGQLRTLWSPYPVVAHHGSLDKHEREEAEEVMKHSQVAVCVATSTLEIGIDIGDVDLVVLADPPWSLEALQQRVGRGSRRSTVIQAAAVCRSEDEQALICQMLEAAASGFYRIGEYIPDRSVVVQQVLSLLFQHPVGISRSDLADLLAPLCGPPEFTAIMNHLVDKGYAIDVRGLTFPSSELMDMGEDGEIHSNIPDHGDYEVVNAETGRPVGRIRGTFDQVFLLAGQSWKVVSIQRNQVLVRRHPQGSGSAEFGVQRNVGRFYFLLPSYLRRNEL